MFTSKITQVLSAILILWTAGVASAHHDIVVSYSENRSNPIIMFDGITLLGPVYIFIEPEAGVQQVRFYIDNVNATGTPDKVENLPPFDLGGTNADDTARPYDTAQLSDGSHTLTVGVDESGAGTEIESVTFIVDNSTQNGLPAGFSESTVITGLQQPTAVKFAPDGRVFVAEKAGRIKVFDDLNDTTATVFASFTGDVWNFHDHGYLGLEVDPGWPARPYVYALYALRGSPGGRLVRFEADSNNLNVSIDEIILLEDWCQVYPSHSIGDLNFGPDGALYLTAGDGASFSGVDWGQDEPHNPDGGPGGIDCQDPPLEGGALRSQDLETSGDPVGLSGTLLRIDPDTGLAYAGNPLLGGITGDDRIVAYGLRNPYRFAVNPLNNEIWICDVGWGLWEEINRVIDPLNTPILNFGWPCYEGTGHHAGYDNANLPICENLYSSGGHTPPFYTYPHAGSSATTGIDFYLGGSYPSAYNDAIFFCDYSRQWIKVMFADQNGVPDPANILDFKTGNARPVDIERGPGGDIFWVHITAGEVRRIEFVAGNQPPQAVITADQSTGPSPLNVQFSGSSSFDPDPGDTIDAYAWDLDGDGQFDDSTQENPSFQYTQSGNLLAGLRVTDNHGASGETTFLISVDNDPPIVTIISPSPSHLWKVGEIISFEGQADDPETGLLPASAFSWEIFLLHCQVDDPLDCHPHPLFSSNNVTSGQFITINHEFPSAIVVRLTITEPGLNGAVVVEEVLLDPETLEVTLLSNPPGLDVGMFSDTAPAPFVRTAIVDSSTAVVAPTPQAANGTVYQFDSWSDAGGQSHTVQFGNQDVSLTANFSEAQLGLLVSDGSGHINGTALASQSVAGNVYIWVSPETNITQVRFYLNDPQQTGSPFQTENVAPYDFRGTNPDDTGRPFDTTTLNDGQHTITTSITQSGGGIIEFDTDFFVSNNVPILVLAPDALDFTVLAGDTDSLQVDLMANDASNGNFSITNNSTWATVIPDSGPFPTSLTVSVDSIGLSEGDYNTTIDFASPGFLSNQLDIDLHVVSPRLEFDTPSVNFSIQEGEADSGAVTLSDNIGGNNAFNIVESVNWLSLQTQDGLTPDQITLNIDSTGLLPGTYGTQVDATATGLDPAQLTVNLIVNQAGGDCSPQVVACGDLLVDLPYVLEFDQDHGMINDQNGIGTGFTYFDVPSNSPGLISGDLEVDLGNGTLEISPNQGIAFVDNNNQDNMIGVGIDAPSQVSVLSTTLINPPTGIGGYAQAGLWYGLDEDNYVKLVVQSHPTSGTLIESLVEVGGGIDSSDTASAGDVSNATVTLQLSVDPVARTIQAAFRINGGSLQVVDTFTPPLEFFGFDAAGVDPLIGTRTFGGIFATLRRVTTAQTYVFEDFRVDDLPLPPPTLENTFTKKSYPNIPFPTAMVWGPDDRLYVTELFGTIHALSFDQNMNLSGHDQYTGLTDSMGEARLTLGIELDPASTPSDVILWLSHSSPSITNGLPNSGTVSKLSGPNLTQADHEITGLPRAIADHATNHIHFSPFDGKLYIAQGGNTGAGAPNLAASEFGDMAEQPLSAALLVADIDGPGFDGSCHNPSNIFGNPPCDVETYATGLRNMYDFVFHSNGRIYGCENGLGVAGTYPPSPTPNCTGLASYPQDYPGSQPDLLLLIEQDNYYGHPNPYRDECVFKDGSLQGVAPLANYVPEMLVLGDNKSANGIIEYSAGNLCGQMQGDLLIANFSIGDDITRIQLSGDGLSVLATSTLVDGFDDPLPMEMGPNGVFFVGEFGGDQVTALIPADLGCWFLAAPMPIAVLDAGGSAIGDALYVVGGEAQGSGHVNSLNIYDSVANNWNPGPDKPGSAVEDLAVVTYNGKLYVFGGGTASFSGAVTEAVCYDPVGNNWTSLAPMPTARAGLTAGVIGNKIYVAGGMDGNGVSVHTLEIYDPILNSWTTGPSMASRRDNPTSAVADGKFYVFGGRIRDPGGVTVDPTLDTVEQFDPATNSWIPRAPMPTGRRATVTGTLNGKIQVFGGENTPAGGPFDANEEYDPSNNTWRVLSPMPIGRHGPVAGTIDGTVYVVGGGPGAGSTYTNANETFSFDLP
jgi:glucose/arabinose dehydrogenase/PKD repeat protein